jgi:site-specific DNA-methyltransferase (adenine-specific)
MSKIDLIQGDCLEKMKDIPSGSVDCIITDPPYGTTACKWDNVIPFEPMWEQLKRIIKPNGAICLFGSEPFSSALRMSNIKTFKYDWVWEKSKASNFLQAKYMPLKAHEIISVFCNNGKSNYYPQKKQGEPFNKGKRKSKDGFATDVYNKIPNCSKYDIENKNGLRNPRTVKYFKTAESEGRVYHPTQKPVALLEYLIKTYTLENETILDFTMGSGSTGIACVNTNRNFIGIELDGGYFEIAQRRICQAEQEKQSKLF